MDRTFTNFIAALRNAEVRVSTAETLDALSAVELVGYDDRELLKNTLSLMLPKTVDEKETFADTFERFFAYEDIDGATETGESGAVDGQGSGEPGNGAGGGEAGAGERGAGGGNRKSKHAFAGAAEDEPEEEPGSGEMASPRSALAQLLMQDSRVELMVLMVEAARAVNLDQIQVFTQKGLYTRRIMDEMGLPDLQREINELRLGGTLAERRLSVELLKRRERLREQVRDYVERQFLLHADAQGRRLREELLRKVKLSNVEHRNFRLIQEIVFKMAKKLIALHSRRKKVFRRGHLDLPRTLRRNMGYDGHIFDLKWKSVKVDWPKVFAICDVSGSVSNYARFMLMFLYSLEEVMPKVRSFAFSSDLAEVTELFERNGIEDAIAKTLRDYGGGSTDYGQAFEDFRHKCLDAVDNRTTIIILGDARNNYGDPRTEILREMYDRAKRVLWLNPEPRATWNVGDAEMRRYVPHVHQAEECNSLLHLERIVGNLLRTVQ